MLTFGVVNYLKHGGQWLTSAGVYTLATAVFGGGAALWWSANLELARTSPQSLVSASFVVYGTTLAMTVLWWQRPSAAPEDVRLTDAPAPFRSARRLGVVLFAGGAALGAFTSMAAVASAVSLLGATLAMSGLLLSPQRPSSFARLLAAAAVFGCYILAMFTGGGRLVVVALGLTLVVIAQSRIRWRYLKAMVLVATIPALLVFSSIGEARSDPNVKLVGGGLASVVNPIEALARIIDENHRASSGVTYPSAIVVMIPRDLWPGKPDGFGAAAAHDLYPDIDVERSGFSVAALLQGEAYYNLGWFGVLLMVPAVGLGIRWLDSRLRLVRTRGISGSLDLYRLIILGIFAGSASDLAWNGIDLWFSRNVLRTAALLPFIYLVVVTWRMRQRKSPGPDPATREHTPARLSS